MAEDLPILAGLEARASDQKRRAPVVEPAETGRPETSKEFAARLKGFFKVKGPVRSEAAEFAARVRDRFVLKGPTAPGERKEGGISSHTEELQSEPAVSTTIADAPAPTPPMELPTQLVNSANAHHGLQSTLVDLIKSSDGSIDLMNELRNRAVEDSFFKTVVEKPREYRNFEVKEGLLYLKEHGHPVLCIPKVMIQRRSAREIVISEAHSLLAHLGTSKTLDYLRDHVWWPDMVHDVKAFCETCMTCKRSKPSNQKPYGLLNPLPIPGHPWESIGIDFVGPLPLSKNRHGSFDSITVIICLLTSMVHLCPSRTDYNARQLAELIFDEVYKHHGVSKNIVSDRDVLFTSIFWEHLHKLLGTKLKMSSAYHPQTDGSTERANRTVTQMLRQCINEKQTDWVSKLPAIEFAINSARSESTGYAPFFLNSGRMPRPMLFNYPISLDEYPSVRNFAIQKRIALMAAHDSIIAARVKQTRDANRKRRVEPFSEGDLVYLSTKNINFPKGLARKLIPKYIGPYKIIEDFGNHSFRLDLPARMEQRGVHNAFHAALLQVHVPNDDRLFPGRLDSQLGIDDTFEGEWTVDRILSHAGSHENSVFEVRWRAGDVTWLPYEKISDLQALTAYLDLLGFDRIADLPLGDGKPPQDDPQVYLGNLTCAHPQHLSATSPSISSSLSAMSVATTEVDVCLAVYRKV